MSGPPERLSGLQLALLRVLWARGEATVAEVHAEVGTARGLATTTVATLLRRLEKRGLLAHRTEGRVFVYRALVSEDEVGRQMVGGLVDDLYEGRADALFAHLLDAKGVSDDDLARIQRLLEARRARAEDGAPVDDPAQ